ncbi:hypothetical protein GCK32_002962 [Trichostrongylus colubriformis]|uniref:SLC12A transporter C-terminal domain-containing protein n=1 Tax=Trichostrongylus colubriformis TaxID=6319 RepID=A0AAN8FHX6_TRICO
MFVMSWATALITIAFFMAVYAFIAHLKPDVNWGTSTTANSYKHAFNAVMKLAKNEPHVKNYRPQVLVLSGAPHERPFLIRLAHSITQGVNLLVCGNVLHEKHTADLSKQLETARKIQEVSQTALRKEHIKGICKVVVASSLESGCMMLQQICGLGRMSPNITFLGFMENVYGDQDLVKLPKRNAYLRIIQQAFYNGMGVAILRSKANNPFNIKKGLRLKTASIKSNDKESVSSADSDTEKTSHEKSTIDVWWLSDDGGLTLLVPYLLTQKGSILKGANLRVFTIAREDTPVLTEEQRMAALLDKFRIKYSYLHVVPSYEKPDEEIREMFFKSLEPFFGDHKEGLISQEELTKMNNKIARHIQTGILLKKYSSNACLVVVTLPFPQKDVSSSLYTNWLDVISRDLPSVLFIRGNHSNVLTFYS